MLKLLKSMSGLFLIFLPVYIVVRFFKWSLHSLEQELTEASERSHNSES